MDLAGDRNRRLHLARIRRTPSRRRARPYITHYGEPKPNLWYRVVCYTAAWIDLLVPFTINLIGLVINFFFGRWIINDLFYKLYYPLAAVIVLATILDFTPRAARSTRDEGAEKGWFYVAVWTVVPTQLAGWAMWRLGKYFDLSPTSLGNVRLATFLDCCRDVLHSGIARQAAAQPALPYS